MTILWNTKKLKEAIGSDLVFIDDKYDFKITNVIFDNRKATDFSLFIAKKGEKNDGHNFIDATLNNNSTVVALANEEFADKFKNNSRVILVKDTIIAMEKMARYSRDNVKGQVIGITGSIGKTTVKELFYSCLSNFGKTFCNILSFNNYMGVLTTLCNLPAETDFAIIEMGMSQKGEMEILSNIVRPDITIILNIASAHLEFFKTEKDIAFAKAEIFNFQKKNFFTILNKDCLYFDILKDEAKKHGISDIISFSEEKNADVILKSYKENKITFQHEISYIIDGKEVKFILDNADYNIAVNLMSLLCFMKKLNLDFAKIENSIQKFSVPRGRNNVEEITFDNKHITLINGTYNAVNPLVFIRGLELMNKIDKNKKYGRKIAIFGDIKEAGIESKNFMLALKEPILEANIDLLIAIGENIAILVDSLKDKVKIQYYKESKDVVPLIKGFLKDNDLVFIKSSKGVKTWTIVDELTGYPTEIFI